MGSSYRAELDRWLRQLEVTAESVLDIGGSQLPVKGRTKTWNVKEYTIADLEEPHVGSPEPEMILDLNVETHVLFHSFDVIFCLEVFEYVWNPAQAMETISELLDFGGTAWISFPSFYPLHQPIEDDALRYMPAGISKLAESVGLDIIQVIKRRPETDALQVAWSAERMRPAKGEDHSFTGFIVEMKK